MRLFVHAILIAAFMLSGISPACKFLSGEAFAMEICKPDGSIVMLVMNPDGTVSEQEKPAQTHADIDCAFCFSSSHLKILAAAELKSIPPGLEKQTGLFAQSADIARESALYLYAPRGPPILIS